MKKTLKYLVSLFAFITCTIGISVIMSAEEYGDFIYEVSGNGVIITAYTGNDTFVYIPDQIDGMDVISIGERAFYYDDNNWLEKDKEKIKLNNSKKNCPKIKNIRLPNRLIMIDKYAFYGCISLENLILPNSLGFINADNSGGSIVQGCKNLSDIVMGDNIYELNSSTFSYGLKGFSNLPKLNRVSLSSKRLYQLSVDESCRISDIYFRGNYCGRESGYMEDEGYFQKSISYHFATKEDMNYCYDSDDKSYNVDVIPLSKSHYRVTFDANGGKIPQINATSNWDCCNWEITGYKSKTSIWTLKGQQVSEEIRPIKEDCTFVGWYDNKECNGEPWNFVLDTVSKNMTLYAKWKPKEFKVTFNTNGGKCETKTALYSFGIMMKSLPVPTKKGYDFAGWYTRKNANGDRFNEKTKMPKNDITLYAAWIKEGTKIKVSLDPNGGKCSKKSVSYKFNQKMKTLPTPSYEGKKFLGWNTQKDGKGTYYTKDMRMDVPSLKLYAIWSKRK